MLLSKQINVYYIVDVHIYKQPERRASTVPRILLSFSHSRETADILSYPQRQRTSNSFLYFTKAKTRFVERVSRAFQLFHSIFKFTTQSVN